jgi:drug/metabolite transporter (DMT)-like permease
MNTLKKALIANTIFSSVSGIILILLHQQIANLFGLQNNNVFWIVGITLLYFAGTIWYEIKKQRRSAILWITTQDFLWVLGSLYLLVVNPFHITQIGNIIIGIIAIIVLFMGISQIIALRKIDRT